VGMPGQNSRPMMSSMVDLSKYKLRFIWTSCSLAQPFMVSISWVNCALMSFRGYVRQRAHATESFLLSELKLAVWLYVVLSRVCCGRSVSGHRTSLVRPNCCSDSCCNLSQQCHIYPLPLQFPVVMVVQAGDRSALVLPSVMARCLCSHSLRCSVVPRIADMAKDNVLLDAFVPVPACDAIMHQSKMRSYTPGSVVEDASTWLMCPWRSPGIRHWAAQKTTHDAGNTSIQGHV
jgi:hypothetical protein